jgi:hypothetical protein
MTLLVSSDPTATFGTAALRGLSMFSAAMTVFWLLAFAFSLLSRPPHLLFVAALAATLVWRAAFTVRRRWPTILEVPGRTEGSDVLRRLAVGTLVSYVALFVAIYALGWAACRLFGMPVEGDLELGLAIMALWAPIWMCPALGSALTWHWSRKDDAF